MMNRWSYVKSLSILIACCLLTACNKDDVIDTPVDQEPVYPVGLHVYEYTPAPGQFIGDVTTGGMATVLTDAESACRWAEERLENNLFVSLGGFGGYITVGLGSHIYDGDGSDFVVYGNAFNTPGNSRGSSNEPGIVYVMRDENRNGLPDDTWYELRGSESDSADAVADYCVTYYRPDAPASDIRWTDNRGGEGVIAHVAMFHPQDYYWPSWIASPTLTLRGRSLPPHTSEDASGRWDNSPYDFGYADNIGRDLIERDGRKGTALDISNAIDGAGRTVELEYIDFIKVQTGVNASCGPLGEVSTEVTGFEPMSR